MKKPNLIFIFLLFFRFAYSQNGVRVTYDEIVSNSITITQLTSNNYLSIYKKLANKGFEVNPGEMKQIIQSLEKNEIYVAKVFNQNKILYPAPRVVDKSKQIIFDSLNAIKWELVSKSPIIKYLGRKVKMAKCSFRNRNYTALYCMDIPISDGPFKFNGLPGLILKIYSDDHFVSFNATKIEFLKNVKIEIAPKYFNNQIQFWEYVKLAKKGMEDDYKQFLSTLPPDQRNIKLNVKIERIEMVF